MNPLFTSYHKPTLVFQLIVLLFVATIIVALSSIHNQGDEIDLTALLAFKNQLVDHPDGALSSWNSSIHHCGWKGVFCDHKHNRVKALVLNSRGLAGTISPSIGNLSFLKHIDLSNNTLSGEIPTNLSTCFKLKFLDLSYNSLQGTLPKRFESLSHLEVLNTRHNNFTGPIFSVIGNLTSLQEIQVDENAFTGTIPDSVGSMRNLTTLRLCNNQLDSVVPESIFNLPFLETLDLINNHLQGQIPAYIGQTLPNLNYFALSGNRFSGAIPPSISNLTNLEILQLGSNQFTGDVPRDFGQMRNLQWLSLADNQLTGDIAFIDTLVHSRKLEVLDLAGNDFFGILPKSIANLSTTLTQLTIASPRIEGEMPSGITKFVNMSFLVIIGTQVTGSIPDDMGKLEKLDRVYLYSNRLTGRIPNSFGSLSRLSRLNLRNNSLQGVIPPSIGMSPNLQFIDLSQNELNGTLSSELFGGSAQFITVDVSQNHLEGLLPLEISKQTLLTSFRVSRNALSGQIPSGCGLCLDLQYLFLDGNSFNGIIPPTFISLRNLVAVNLSHNSLSGPLSSISPNNPLLYLNLSYNDFEGTVPINGIFANATVVSLVGNTKLCGGISDLHLPKCGKKRLPFAIKSILSIMVALAGVLLVVAAGLYLFCVKKKNNNNSVKSDDLVKDQTFMKVSYNMLLKATDSFSSKNRVGRGSFGSVYKGTIEGNTVAVKVFDMEHHGALKSFMAECRALRNFSHRNLVGIITACSSIDFQGNDFKALIYEFMLNGSLDDRLHGARNLSLLRRVDIAIDVAHALNYLHHHCEIPIVHCDLKPSNVLLDNEMVARVGDFGISKFLAPPELIQSSTIGVRGTVGYAAPEYGLGSEASTNGDVYSFGILLLELVTGIKPTDNMFNEGMNLHMYAKAALPDNLLEVVDASLQQHDIFCTEAGSEMKVHVIDERQLECIVTLVSVGVACSEDLPHNRMKIADAISKLQAVRNNLLDDSQRISERTISSFSLDNKEAGEVSTRGISG